MSESISVGEVRLPGQYCHGCHKKLPMKTTAVSIDAKTYCVACAFEKVTMES